MSHRLAFPTRLQSVVRLCTRPSGREIRFRLLRSCAFFVVANLLSVSVFAVPEAPRFLVVTLDEAKKEALRDIASIEFGSVSGWTDGLFGLIAKPAAKQQVVERVDVNPANLTVLQDEEIYFTAVAFERGQPINSVRFRWSVSELGGSSPARNLANGRFKASKIGTFRVTATANGSQGQTTITVRRNYGRAIQKIVRKPEAERTSEERALIERLRTEGRYTSREVLSTQTFSLEDERRRTQADEALRDLIRSRQPSLVSPTPTPGVVGSRSDETAIPDGERKIGGPSDSGESEAATEPNASNQPPFFLMDEIGWDGTNWSLTDDPENRVGNAAGAAPDDGASNGNYNLSVPVVSLPGRGMDLNLSMNYNSRVWQKGGTAMMYDADNGFPAPGWNLGFGRMYYLGSTGGCMMVAPDGTRRPYTMTQNPVVNGYNYYNHYNSSRAIDGSFADYDCSYTINNSVTTLSGSAVLADGTKIVYSSPSTTFDQLFPTKITDAQGNYISITYRNNRGPYISTVTDTLGRVVTFNYTSDLLTSITGPGYNGTNRTFVQLRYSSALTLTTTFGLAATAPDTTPDLIDAIYFPTTNTGYWFGDSDSYSPYGMIAKVLSQRGMSFTSSINQGTMTRQEVYNFPTSGNSSLVDAPGYSTHTETWDGMDTSAAVTGFNVTTESGGTQELISVTRPDGSVNKQKSYIGSSYNGMYHENEIFSGSTLLAKTKITLEAGAYSTTRPNKVEQTEQTPTGDKTKRTEFTYGTTLNQLTNQKEFDYSGNLYRDRRYTYENSSAYLDRHIFSLLKTDELYDSGNTRLSRTEYQYDNNIIVNGASNHGLVEVTGAVQHDYTYDPFTDELVWIQGPNCLTWQWNFSGCTYEGEEVCFPPNYDVCEKCNLECVEYEYIQVSAYNENTAFRGNLTKVTSYENAGPTPTGAISYDFTYDVTGNQRTATTNCCQQISSSYSVATQFSQPDSVTKGSSNTGSPDRVTQSATYDFNTGAIISATDFNGLTTTVGYDAVTRPTLVTFSSGAKKTTTFGDASLSQTELVQKSTSEGSGTVGNSTTYFNGRGQPVKSVYQAGGSGFNTSSTMYDVMGRLWKASMPHDSGSSPAYWTEYSYDFLSRMTQQTAPDGSTSKMFYNGTSVPASASSSFGQTVRSQDAWGRERWSKTDAFGRLVEVVEPNPTGTTGEVADTGNIATSYAYDASDELTAITQGTQTRSFAYDSLGRLTRQKLAEQAASLDNNGGYVTSGGIWSEAFVYDSRSNLIQRTDARGVKTNLSYQVSGSIDPLNRLQGISYDKSGAANPTTIAAAASVSMEYMTTGDKSRVKKVITSGIATEENAFDSLGRISEYKITLDSRSSYPFETDYSYDSTGRLTQIDYPAQYGLTGNPRKAIVPSYDEASRLTQMTVAGVTHLSDVAYNNSSQVSQLKTGAGTNRARIEAYSYEAQTGLLTGQTVKNNALTSTYLDLSYSYSRGNSSGTLNGKTGQLTGIVDNLNRNKDRKYEFDAIGRLDKAMGGIAAGASGVTANWTQDYTYDRFGNKTGVSATGVDANNAAVPVDGLTSVSFDTANNRTTGWDYDLAGNLTRGETQAGVWQRFDYDAAGRMVAVKDDAYNVLETVTYAASRERRLMVQTATQLTYYAWGGRNVIGEYADNGSMPYWKKSYHYAGSRLLSTSIYSAQLGVERSTFYHPDRLGTRLTTSEASSAAGHQSTLPFGTAMPAETTSTNPNPYFTSYDRSALTNLDYAVNRTYSSSQSRFTQVDPIGMSAASVGSPQSNNLYAYVQNMPTDFVDPSGLFEAPPRTITFYEFCLRTGLCGGPFLPPPSEDPGGGGGGEPAADTCGINPVTGTPGINPVNSGKPGEIRPGVRGLGHFGAPRNNSGKRYSHTGTDIAAPVGSTVQAFAPGIIQSVTGTTSGTTGYGLTIILDHGNGYTSHYAHLSASNSAFRGFTAAGSGATTVIGFSGQSGNASGQPATEAHLHFEIRKNGRPLNPEDFLNSPCPRGFQNILFPR
ncbi:MAG: peptidoglycan DD-metalloendopeptidase family protein [Pyrinomonadaceae bacterium]